jgi:hypothetical protein
MRARLIIVGITLFGIVALARGSQAAPAVFAASIYLPIIHLELQPTVTPSDTATVAPPKPTPEGTATPTTTMDNPLDTHGQDLYNCTDFSTWAEANAVYQANLPGDPNHLDSDSDGIPCESLPGAP